MRSLLRAALERSGWIKLGLFVGFFWLVVLPIIVTMFNSPSNSSAQTTVDLIEASRQMHKIMLDVEQRAKSLGKNYTPEQYFIDLKILESSSYRNQAPSRFDIIHRIMARVRENYSMAQIDAAREKIGTVDSTSPEVHQHYERIFSRLPSWLLERYLFCLPLALILFLLWFYGELDKTKRRWPNLWRFVLALAIYPIVIVSVWHSRLTRSTRGWLAEASFRQGKRQVTQKLSAGERAQIQRFATGQQSWRSWRQSLVSQGWQSRHSFALALVATMVLIVCVRAVPAQTLPCVHQQVSIQQDDGHLPRDKIDNQQPNQPNGTSQMDWVVLTAGYQEPSLANTGPVIVDRQHELISYVPRPPDHIPITGCLVACSYTN